MNFEYLESENFIKGGDNAITRFHVLDLMEYNIGKGEIGMTGNFSLSLAASLFETYFLIHTHLTCYQTAKN